MDYKEVEIKAIYPLKDHVIVTEMNFNERTTSGGIVVVGDDAKLQGIRPRWGKVYAIGPKQTDVKIGDWILVAHGRWTRGVKIKDATGTVHTIRRVDNNDILMVSDELPTDDTVGQGL
jgi:co-chaperonin GroES (HSP10)